MQLSEPLVLSSVDSDGEILVSERGGAAATVQNAAIGRVKDPAFLDDGLG
jgi:hypothetical protein